MKPGIHPDHHPVMAVRKRRTSRCGATQEPRSASTRASTPGGSGGRP
jgi:ribosomal protein L31